LTVPDKSLNTNSFGKEIFAMRKSNAALFAAAVVSVGAFTFTPSAFGQDSSNPTPDNRSTGQKVGDAVGNAADKTGDAAKKAVDKTEQAVGLEASDNPETNAKNIRGVIAEVAEAALTKSGLDDLEERLSKSDRDRLDQNKDALKNNSELDGRIEQFQKDWKAKYNQDFKIPDKNAVYSNDFATISQGADARTASERVAPDASSSNSKINTSDSTSSGKNIRDFASVQIPASHGKPAITVPFVHEARGWKIDLPDSVDSNKLRDNVQAALTKCDEMKDQWPSDVNDAYRGVTHAVLMAIMDQKADSSTSAQPASGQLPADQGTSPSTSTPAVQPSATPSK